MNTLRNFNYGRIFFDAPTEGSGATGTPPPTTVVPPTVGGTTPPAPATPPGNSTTTTQNDWVTGIKNDELRGFVQTKGFKDPEILAESYRNLEKLIGVPKEQIIKKPGMNATPEEINNYHQQLGRPKDMDGYGLKPIEGATPADVEFNNWAKDAFFKANVTSEQAQALTNGLAEFQKAQAQKQTEATVARDKTENDSLQAEWGAAFKEKFELAKTAAKTFGMTDAQINQLQSTMGYSQTMKFLNGIGSKLGEGTFVNGEGRGGNQTLDVPQARAALATKKADSAFMAKYMAGDAQAKTEMGKLFEQAYPGEFTV